MSYYFPKTKLIKYSLFSIKSKKYGFGHYKRIENLISILKVKKKNFYHYSFGDNKNNKIKFLNKLKLETHLSSIIILDVTNDFFLDKKTLIEIKKILIKKKNKVFIIDSPEKKNLSTSLNLTSVQTLIPFDITNEIKQKIPKNSKNKFGSEYFIYPKVNKSKKNKIYDIIISFGSSDNYKGTIYVIKILKKIKLSLNVLVVLGKFFKKNYKKKIYILCKKNNYKILNFSNNFSNSLRQSKLLITNSGLTKYEAVLNGIPVIVFSDTKKSEKIDKIFLKKTKQRHFSYLKREEMDALKLKMTLKKKLKLFDKNLIKTNIENIKKFFLNE